MSAGPTCCRSSAGWPTSLVSFHPGFRASPDDFDPEYRGAHIVELARLLGVELTPRVVGDAARAGHHPPQHIKQVWHCLARFGRTSVDT